MTSTVQVRSIVIGEGRPKIIVPIVGATKEAILAAAASFKDVALDIVEWRVDHFADVCSFEAVKDTAEALRTALGDTPILFTFRTKKEGGERAIDAAAYAKLNCRIAETKLVDLIDVEAFSGDAIVREIIDAAHASGVKVVASNHDFSKTPEQEELIRRLQKMQELGADIPKIAVMPTCRRDVLTLLSATEQFASELADRPIITMSMAGTGMISRLSGEAFGSSCTFGAVGAASAPGQMNAKDLDTILTLIHQSMSV